jgi:hypothetical protein
MHNLSSIFSNIELKLLPFKITSLQWTSHDLGPPVKESLVFHGTEFVLGVNTEVARGEFITFFIYGQDG